MSRAGRPAGLRGPAVLAIPGPRSGTFGTWWRAARPFHALQQRGYPVFSLPPARDSLPVAGLQAVRDAASVVQFEPLDGWHPDALAREVDAAHARGQLVVFDLDDDLLTADGVAHVAAACHDTGNRLPPSLSHGFYSKRAALLSQADGVIVSTEPLAEVARRYTGKPVLVVGNAIDLAWWRVQREKDGRVVSGPTIGWGGSVRPNVDLAAMAEAWGRVAARYPEAQFLVMGQAPPVVREHVPAERLIALPWGEMEQWAAFLRNMDISCCSVADVPFNRCKTPIKSWESAAAGAAVIASPVLYGDVIEHGQDGFLATTADEWEAAVTRLLEDGALRERLARRLVGKVEARYSLDANVWRWPAAWRAIAEHHRAGALDGLAHLDELLEAASDEPLETGRDLAMEGRPRLEA
jgi:glycosyltransferase involved in cell wall biosynthesis